MRFLSSFTPLFLLAIFAIHSSTIIGQNHQNVVLDETAPYLINASALGFTPSGGDTIFIASTRVRPLKFVQLEGSPNNPIVVINKDGQVKIDATSSGDWGALVFENSKHIKVTGAGHPGYKYGFLLAANEAGLAFSELSSDCEAEFVKISHDGFFGIYAKKDYDGNPPSPYPVFNNLIIHDCFIEGVSEGLYLGETKSPGMEFKHVKIYNNIIRNTLRESIQVANMTEDVEIYNNTLINAGLEDLNFHRNNLQIGDNSVANIYNNIIIGAKDFGIINFGKGNVTIHNNYIAESKGIFSDNRLFSDASMPITVSNNYFRSLTGNEVIRNMNEINFFTAENNVYDVAMNFYNGPSNSYNESLVNNVQSGVSEIQFADIANNNYALATDTFNEYLEMGAPGGPEFFEYDDPATTPRQLVISPEMVIDSVFGGSVFSPLYLFDEQHLSIATNEKPESKSWKPDYSMKEDAYHAIVDLGDEHFISELHLHDMHDVKELTVEYFTNDAWQTLFIEPCNNFKVWKIHETAVQTRYLRFSMYESPYAAVNEVLIYGYPIVKPSAQIVIETDMVTDLVDEGSVDSPNFLFDEQGIDIENGEKPTSKSWKPFYNSNKAPYYAEIDLGTDYRLSEIKLHDMHNTKELKIQYRNGEQWKDLVVESLNGFRVWRTHKTNAVARYLRLVMETSPYASVNEILFYGYPIMTLPENTAEQQIVIASDMIYDLVDGGSVDSANYLFDEQEVSPFLGEHPISKNWKPFYNNTKAPYYVEIDLVDTYNLSKIRLHDMHSTYDFIIEYKDASNNWVHLLTESCNAYKVWKTHEFTGVTTSRLRLSMLESPYAGVNEILIYGSKAQQKSVQGKIVDDALAQRTNDAINPSIEIFPNPVIDKIFVKGIHQEASMNQIRILDVLGKTIYAGEQKNVQYNGSIQVDVDSIIQDSGTYILLYHNNKGQQKRFKFIKS